MKKEMIFGIVILIVLMGIIPGIIIFKSLDNTNYNRIYISSLEFDGRLAEYRFKPEVSNDEPYKIRLKLKMNKLNLISNLFLMNFLIRTK